MENNSIKLQLLELKEQTLRMKAKLVDIYEEASAEDDIQTMHQACISYDECDKLLDKIDYLFETQML